MSYDFSEKITIVIPTINRDSLKYAIDSVIYQTKKCHFIVVEDRLRIGAGPTRNSVASIIKTPWTGFLDDDDDVLDQKYVEWFEQESEGNDVVIFRMKYGSNSLVMPRFGTKRLSRGNVGISFALKTSLFIQFPFIKEDPINDVNEDWIMIKNLMESGCKIHISDKIAYKVRPDHHPKITFI